MRISRRAPPLFKSVLLAGLALAAAPAVAADSSDNHELATKRVLFGRGLNTAQPGNPVNHAILPNEIKIKAGGVVDFGVAGFHDIIVFKPGVTLDDLVNAGGGVFPSTPPVFVIPPDPATPLPPALASLADQIYYRGLKPAGGPPATPSVDNPDNSFNRNEPIAFLEAGTYLVICNVRPHLLDGMWATVKVLK
jgi:plastocyanin